MNKENVRSRFFPIEKQTHFGLVVDTIVAETGLEESYRLQTSFHRVPFSLFVVTCELNIVLIRFYKSDKLVDNVQLIA